MAGIIREPISFASADRASQIKGWLWLPEGTPKGIVQLTHGMAEHIGRYDEFARFLAGSGFAVCGHDQVGHGASAPLSKHGCLPAANGADVLISDVDTLRHLMQTRAGIGTPYFLFGHSLGSFIVRSYISRHGTGLAGAIICGTGHVPPATSKAGNTICHLICRLKGEDAVSGLLSSMGVGAYAKAIKDAAGPLDWLSYNRKNIERYEADPLCGFPFSAGGYATVTALTAEVCAPACFERIPHDLPLLFIAGDGDPVGNSGEGVRTAFQMARDAGSVDAYCIIYEHMRHEILNEDERGRVMEDIDTWLEEHV